MRREVVYKSFRFDKRSDDAVIFFWGRRSGGRKMDDVQ